MESLIRFERFEILLTENNNKNRNTLLWNIIRWI